MKNILNDIPNEQLTGRLKFTVKKFVKAKDIIGKKVLDIGCGYGWFELNALERGVKEIVGIEITKEDLKTAKSNINDKRATFKVAGALKLPFKDNYFDTVVAWEVIEHIPKNTEDIMFKEVGRVLKKDGVFYLSTPYDSLPANLLDPAFWLTGHRHYSKEKLKKYAEESTMKVTNLEVKGKFWQIFSLLNMYISKWIFRRESFLKELTLKKVDKEYMKGNGYTNIFVRYKK